MRTLSARALSARERKLIAVALLLAAIAGLYLLVLQPILGGFAARAERRETLLAEYAHNDRTIASIPRLRRSVERNADQLQRFVIHAPDADRAGLLLEDRLRRAVEAAGGEFQSSEHAPTPAAGSVQARASARLTLAQTVMLLEQLQNTPPYLAIDALTLTAEDALSSTIIGPLEVRLDVSVPFVPALS